MKYLTSSELVNYCGFFKKFYLGFYLVLEKHRLRLKCMHTYNNIYYYKTLYQ